MSSLSRVCFDLIYNNQTIAAAIISTLVSVFVLTVQNIITAVFNRKEKRDFENAIVASIYEELLCLYNGYKEIFEKSILEVKDEDYIITTFTITQDFFTIYHNNASNIGKIKTPEIRNSIVQVYILMKKFIENILYYNSSFSSFLDRRRELICEKHGLSGKITFNSLYLSDDYICEALSNFLGLEFVEGDYKKNMLIIDKQLRTLEKIPPILNIFMPNDDCARKNLIKETNKLKEIYTTIKTEIIKTAEMIKKKYNITSDSIINKTISATIQEVFQNVDLKETERVNN